MGFDCTPSLIGCHGIYYFILVYTSSLSYFLLLLTCYAWWGRGLEAPQQKRDTV